MEEQREHKVAELEKHTHGWVDSVIDTFRKSSKPQFVRADTQDSQRGGAGKPPLSSQATVSPNECRSCEGWRWKGRGP